MRFKFSPVRANTPLEGSVQGDFLTLNGQVLDFSEVAEGCAEPFTSFDCSWLGSDVTRLDGEIYVTVIIPHGSDAPQETLFPANFTSYLQITEGPLPIPLYENPQVEV